MAVLDSPGSTTVEAGATLTADRIREASLTVSGAVNLRPNGAPANASKVNALAINPGGKLDLTNNALLIDYAPTEPSPIQDVRNDLLTGALTSSTTVTNPNITLAYGEAPTLFDLSTGVVTYGDHVLDPSTLLLPTSPTTTQVTPIVAIPCTQRPTFQPLRLTTPATSSNPSSSKR